MDHDDSAERSAARGGRLLANAALIGFLLVAGYFLFTEHRAHAVQYLPVLLLVLCPVLHLLHHGAHTEREHTGKASGPAKHDHA